ncbi:unnamed protein product [Zymoseptoria tritici ST99CH_1A5]|uniref:GID complex catalytic subunit 2 n=2 Tax=Zymoseptoria tritici TaxID=1047171 RepID=A0A1X7RR83_ZYMT9|nr:unnamed protein product [Zymoseptoria tritici ST99CH_3D7]SMR51675.1 unnamed protein product [Zymoseptoria tritici ST99CH_3D1]SMY23440.1 unnamed protein product [Zymoseptoria tritici ST99CH_1A5]
MDALIAAHEQQEKKGNLSAAITDVQKLIDLLQNARDAVADNPDMAPLHLAKLQKPVKQSFTNLEDDLKEVNKGLNAYRKALDNKFKNAVLPTASNDALASQPQLINRAIAMHLLREGKFDVAKTFVREVQENPVRSGVVDGDTQMEGTAEGTAEGTDEEMPDSQQQLPPEDGIEQLVGSPNSPTGLQTKFAEMYHILDALRNHHDLSPAIAWAAQNSSALEHRGSNLEFELSRLKFVELYTSPQTTSPDDPFSGPLRALEYARTTFPAFSTRYRHETSLLLGSLAFSPSLQTSPYTTFFQTPSLYTSASESFTREFCGLLGLSSLSPLYTAVTAGGIALPILTKVERVLEASRGQWTSVNELPVETPLPDGFAFHQIFVCPVSKEQGTDANPPMMLPCGHVIARESLEAHSKGKARMKCPYCPQECHPREAKRVYI